MLKLALRTFLTPQFAVYLVGGVLSAAVDIGMFKLLLVLGWPTLGATSVAFLAGLLVNFSFHARLTFGKVGAAVFGRYLCLVALNYALTVACVSVFDLLWQQALLGKVLSLPLAAANGFVLGKRWVFR
jgi:putative flippase GtrA